MCSTVYRDLQQLQFVGCSLLQKQKVTVVVAAAAAAPALASSLTDSEQTADDFNSLPIHVTTSAR